jgi:type IV pilus assembly protein PilC
MSEPQLATESISPFAGVAAEEVIECAVSLVAGGSPLPAGLRAAAAEADSARVAARLRHLAAEIERGRSLEDCLAHTAGLPPYVAGLIRAAQRTGDMGVTITAWTVNRRSARQYWRSMLASLAYPTIAVVLAIAVFLFLGIAVVPTFDRMFQEFGLKLPMATVYVLRASNFATRLFPFVAGLLLAVAVGTRVFGGRAGWSALVTNLPMIGPAWHWTGVAEMLRGLGLLVEHRVPLPEALRLTAGGIADAYIAQQCRALATRVEGGRSLTMSLVDLRTLPLSIVPLVRWGEQHDQLDASLRSAAEMIENRLKVRSSLLAQVIPPLLYIFVLVSVVSAFLSLFLPLISLIQGLS